MDWRNAFHCQNKRFYLGDNGHPGEKGDKGDRIDPATLDTFKVTQLKVKHIIIKLTMFKVHDKIFLELFKKNLLHKVFWSFVMVKNQRKFCRQPIFNLNLLPLG